jgi:FkbM family methyltransferase
MVTEVSPSVHEPRLEELASEPFLERQLRRADILVYAIGAIGLANTVKVVYDNILPNSQERVIQTRPNHSLRFPLTLTTAKTDLFTLWEILRDDAYKLPSQFKDNINGKPIVDLGSYVGISPAYFASRFPDSPVLAVEPNRRNFELLEENAEPYDGQITPVMLAFWNESGQVGSTVRSSNPHNHVSSVFANHVGSGPNGSTTSAITPEDILGYLKDTERIVVKADIEGAEKETFSSPTIDPLLARTDLLLVETHDRFVPGSSQAVCEAAERNGLKPAQPGGHTNIYYRI